MVPEMHTFNILSSPINTGMKKKKLSEMVTEEPMKAPLRALGKTTGHKKAS